MIDITSKFLCVYIEYPCNKRHAVYEVRLLFRLYILFSYLRLIGFKLVLTELQAKF